MTAEWPRGWRARWIWWERADIDGAFVRGEMPPRPHDGFGYLRRSFTLARRPARARCRITCDGRYLLHVNGAVVGRGPIRSQPWRLSYDTYDIGPLLGDGENVVAVLARHYGGPTTWWQPATRVGALGYGSLVFEALLDEEWLVSDERWRTHVAPYDRRAQVDGPPPDEVLDGRAVPSGWAEPGFDDGGWAPAAVVGPSPPTEPFAELGPRPIASLAEVVLDPVRSDDSLFDFGTIVHAHPSARIEAEPGAEIELRCGEAVRDGEPVTDVRSWRLRYTASGSPGETVEAFEPVGFRYVQADVVRGRARVEVAARERIYPRAPGASFACSDPALEAIWRAGVRSVDVCSTDAFVDCPGREQRAWLSDAYGHALVSLLTNPDTRLVRWTLRLHAGGVRADGMLPMVAAGDFGLLAEAIPDQALIWILGLALYHQHTGDEALVEELLPVALGVLGWFERHRGPDGLLADLPGWIFIDWAQVQRGRSIAVMDALFALATSTTAELAASIGDERTAGRLRARADRTREAFEGYYDNARRVYVDALDSDGMPTRRVSQHANALAILAGCAPRARWSSMLDAALDPSRLVRTRTPADPGDLGERVRSPELEPEGFDDEHDVVLAQPFFSHFVHRAVARAGRHDLLPGLVRRWAPLAERGAGCLPEYWDAPPGRASLCHAWSAVPVYDLATEIVGIKSRFNRVAIEPHLGDLAWAEASVATPHGWARARIQADGEGWVDVPIVGELVLGGHARRLSPGRTSLGAVPAANRSGGS